MEKKKEKSEWYIGPILGLVIPLIVGFIIIYCVKFGVFS